jgi:hypothetical protein
VYTVAFTTGIALVNPGATQANVTATFTDDTGKPIPTATSQIVLNPGQHQAFVLTAPGYFPEVSGKRGVVQFTSNVPINGLGIRFNGTAFTSIDAVANVAPGNKIISHLANGGANGVAWSTTILLVNADTHTASYQLNFHNEADGSPLVLPLVNFIPEGTVLGTLAPGQLAVIQTDGAATALVEGWVELVTSDAIGGTGIFTARGAVGGGQEAAVPLNSAGGTQLFIPFDETSGTVAFTTGIALVNSGATQANVTATFTDDTGKPIPTATSQIVLNPGQHQAFVLTAAGYFPEVSGKRGVVQFTSNVPINGLGIRFNGTAFTSIEAIARAAN